MSERPKASQTVVDEMRDTVDKYGREIKKRSQYTRRSASCGQSKHKSAIFEGVVEGGWVFRCSGLGEGIGQHTFLAEPADD